MINQAWAQAAIGGGAAVAGGIPLWLQIVEGVTFTAGMIAAVCGAIVGLHGVWKIWRNRNRSG